MSEFKFACPVCGQHITADSSATGSHLDCPTCFRKIVVPQAPSSTESKFVLSASEAAKQRPTPTPPIVPADTPRAETSRRWMPLALSAFAVVALAVGALLYFFPDKFSGRGAGDPGQSGTNSPPGDADASVRHRIPSATNLWTLDLTGAPFPEEPAFGKVRGAGFFCDRAVLQGGALNLRMGKEWPPELGLTVYLFARGPEELSEKSALITTNNIRSPKVVLRWKEGSERKNETFTNGFALKLEFGEQQGNRLPGKMFLCLPDDAQSWVAGTFNAEIRKPSPPKPKPH